jgi:hypothetical protein
MGFDESLKDLLRTASGGKTDCPAFITTTKENHQFAIEFCARLLRFTIKHHGPIKNRHIHPWLSKQAVAEFQSFLKP